MSASTTRSPSRVTRRRKTAWVLGCCAPTFTTKGSVFIAGASLLVLARKLAQAGVAAAGHAQPILAQGMTGEAIPQEDPSQGRVALEVDAHQVIHFALLELSALPQR